MSDKKSPVTASEIFKNCGAIIESLIDDAEREGWRKGYAQGWADALHHVLCAVEKQVPVAPPTIPIDPARRPRRNEMLELVRDDGC
jgi:hypothetical protein